MSKNCNSFSDALCVALLGKYADRPHLHLQSQYTALTQFRADIFLGGSIGLQRAPALLPNGLAPLPRPLRNRSFLYDAKPYWRDIVDSETTHLKTPKAFKGPGFRLSDSKASTATATSPSSVSPVNTNYTIKVRGTSQKPEGVGSRNEIANAVG